MKNKIKVIILFVLFSFGFIFGAEAIFGTQKNGKVFATEDENTILPSGYCLRDEYFIQTANQHGQGLCWDFASSMAFTTTVMKSTNQYIDYSEGWVSNYISATKTYYDPGEGGTFSSYSNAIKESGVVLEQDFNYEDSYQITKENTKEFYSYYTEYADTTIVKNYKIKNINYNMYGEESDFEDFKRQVKYHLLNEGGLYVDFGWTTSNCIINSQRVYYRNPTSTQTSGGHALCIIGWDDDITIVHEGLYYKGAWLFINSWGNTSGNQGIFYLLYEDRVANYFHGFEYVEDKDELYFFNKLEDSSASFTSDLKDAYTGSFLASTVETKQKNIFYNTNNVELKYGYELSPETELTSIEILKDKTDITNQFNISINNKYILINSIENLNIGAYSIKFTYANQTESEWTYGVFYILNGTETEYITVSANTTMSINRNNNLQSVCPMQNGYDYLCFGTEFENPRISIYIYTATYSNIYQAYIKDPQTDEILIDSYLYPQPRQYFNFTYNFDFSSYFEFSNYCKLNLYLIGEDASKVIDIYFYNVDNESQSLVRMNYNTYGGENSNSKTLVVSNTEPTAIENPTKEGYGFVGWYYSKNFEDESILMCNDGKFYLEYDKVIHYNDCTTYWSNGIKPYIDYNFKSFILYAKWFKFETGKTYHTIVSNVKGNGYVSQKGYIYVEDGSTKSISIDSQGYDIVNITIDNTIISTEQYFDLCQNGIIFENITENHDFYIEFIPRTDTVYKVYHYKQALTETDYFFNDIYYDEPIIETYYGTTDKFTDIQAYDFDYFEELEFAQQKIMRDGKTIINIFYNRYTYDISIKFNGIRFDSIKYDIYENVLYGAEKTYNVVPLGYRITNCKVNNQNIDINEVILLSNIDCDYDIIVDVEEKLFDITHDVGQNGEFYCSGTESNIADGEVRYFTIIANDGYVIKNVYVNGKIIKTDNGSFKVSITDDLDIKAELVNLRQITTIAQILVLVIPIISTCIVFGTIYIKRKKESRRKKSIIRININNINNFKKS